LSKADLAETSSSRGASDLEHIVLSFDDNNLATQLFGQFDQHLALLEQQLGVEAVARGNTVDIQGDEQGSGRAKSALEHLYRRLQEGATIEPGDVEGAIRMATSEDQLSLPTMEKSGKLSMAQIGTRRKTIQARTKTQDAYIRAMDRAELVFGIGPAGTGKTYLANTSSARSIARI